MESLEHSEKVLRHLKSIVDDLLVYCDRDEELQTQVIVDGLNGLKNVINLEIDEN